MVSSTSAKRILAKNPQSAVSRFFIALLKCQTFFIYMVTNLFIEGTYLLMVCHFTQVIFVTLGFMLEKPMLKLLTTKI